MPKPVQIFPEGVTERWLPDHVEVWRYIPLRTLFFYLNGLVFIPSVAKLRTADPFEGEFYEKIAWFNSAFGKTYGSETDAIEKWMFKDLCSDYERQHIEMNRHSPNAAAEIFRRHYFDFVRRTRSAWCWFKSYRESAAMWSIYGNQGVAVKSSIGKICKVLENTNRDFIYGRMTYVDYQSGVSTEFNPEDEADYHLLLRPFFLKRKEYESENEVRFVTSGHDRLDRGGILMKKLPPQEWISEIRLWPGLTHDEEQSIQRAVQHFIPTIDCQKSDLFSGPDSSSFLTDLILEDLEKPINASWAQNSDGIPNPLKSP